MTHERNPRPGKTWETALRQIERVVEDGEPEPRPNRAARRRGPHPVPSCQVVDIDGTPVTLTGVTRDLTDQDHAALAELARAVQAMAAAEPPEVTAEREQRQAASRRRIHDRLDQLSRKDPRR